VLLKVVVALQAIAIAGLVFVDFRLEGKVDRAFYAAARAANDVNGVESSVSGVDGTVSEIEKSISGVESAVYGIDEKLKNLLLLPCR
jgi:hypothetical protein